MKVKTVRRNLPQKVIVSHVHDIYVRLFIITISRQTNYKCGKIYILSLFKCGRVTYAVYIIGNKFIHKKRRKRVETGESSADERAEALMDGEDALPDIEVPEEFASCSTPRPALKRTTSASTSELQSQPKSAEKSFTSAARGLQKSLTSTIDDSLTMTAELSGKFP